MNTVTFSFPAWMVVVLLFVFKYFVFAAALWVMGEIYFQILNRMYEKHWKGTVVFARFVRFAWREDQRKKRRQAIARAREEAKG